MGQSVHDAIWDYVVEVDRAVDQRELESRLKALMREEGFDLFAYLELHPNESRFNSYRITTYPEEWIERYEQQSYRDVDPSVVHAKKAVNGLVWPTVSFAGVPERTVAAFYDEASQCGIQSGFSLPIHGPGALAAMLTAAADAPRDDLSHILASNVHAWRMLLASVFVTSMRFRKPQERDVSLTPRQSECLLWTARGKTAKDVATILSISERTVVQHLTNCCRKFDVYSKHLAVVKAITTGLIAP